MSTGLESIVSYFPESTVTAADYGYLESVTPAGMDPPREKRRLALPDAAEVLAIGAAHKALESAALGPADIDLIVAENIGGQYIIPGLAAFIHHRLGFRRETPAWNLQNCCASFLDGCFLASRLITGDGEFRRALVVAVTALETGGWGTDRSSFVSATMGDGAGAAIVSRQNLKCEILAYANITCGETYHWMTMSFDPPEQPALLEGLAGPFNVATGPHTTDSGFEGWCQTTGRKLIGEGLVSALKKAGLTVTDVDAVIVHQAFSGLIEMWKEELEAIGVPRTKWKDTFDRYGNVGAVDPAATLAEWMNNESLPEGSIIALFAPGGGGHTPTMILRWLAATGSGRG